MWIPTEQANTITDPPIVFVTHSSAYNTQPSSKIARNINFMNRTHGISLDLFDSNVIWLRWDVITNVVVSVMMNNNGILGNAVYTVQCIDWSVEVHYHCNVT